MSRTGAVIGVGALGLTLSFLILPIVGIVSRVGPLDILRQLSSKTAQDAIMVSLTTSLMAHAIILVVGTPTAYVLATRRVPARELIVSLIEMPLVLPPAVAGIGLFAAFGSQGLLGESLDVIGLRIPFTRAAVVMAIVFVASPFYIRGAMAAFATVDRGLVDVARTLGAGPWRVAARVYLPLAGGGLGAASTLAFARGLGEFGATILFAGSFPGRTETLPLAIYAEFTRDFETALAIGALLIAVSLGLLVSTKLVGRMSPHARVLHPRRWP